MEEKIVAENTIKENEDIRIITEEINEEYYYIGTALEERGYVKVDCSGYLYVRDYFIIGVYKKDGKYYGVIEFEHFNTLIYHATLTEANSLEELEDFVRRKDAHELESELVGKILTLDELDSEVCKILKTDCYGPSDYGRDMIFGGDEKGGIGDSGSCDWINYNIWFTVEEEAEVDEDGEMGDIGDIVVRVDWVDIIDV